MIDAEAVRLTGHVIELKKENESLIKMLAQVEPLLTFCPVCKSPLLAVPEPENRGHTIACKLWGYIYISKIEHEGNIFNSGIDPDLGW